MKKKYMDLVYTKLIQEMDYMPLTNNEGEIIQYENIKILQKYTGKELLIVELINANSLSEHDMKNRIQSSRKRMDQMNQINSMYIFEIFIFDSSPNQYIIEEIQNASKDLSYDGKFLFCSVVGLEDNTVTDYNEFKMYKNNPTSILKDALNQNYNEIDNSVDIKQLVKEKLDQQKIKFVAKKPYLTYGLIAANIIIFIIFHIVSYFTNIDYGKLIVEYGAKVNSGIISGEYWRFFTPIFIHSGISHLLVNCYSLYILGSLIERIYGHKKYGFIYIIAGIFGSIMSFMFSAMPSVGASGSIFGLIGAMLYFGVENPTAFKKYFKNSVITILLLNAFFMFTASNIDNFGHLGGLIGGFLASGIVKLNKVSKKFLGRPTFIAVTVIALVGGLYYGFNAGDNTQTDIFRKAIMLESHVENKEWEEARALGNEILDMNPTDEEIHLIVIRLTVHSNISLGRYNEAIEIAKYAKEIDLANGHFILGLVYISFGQYEQGIEEFEEAIKIDPQYKESIDPIIESIDSNVS
ncbi:rhomboid family intramembrane serine protease [Herbivorax sp. ANBcel31]|uniref:rhomboid family protein n=1 Tax=Herbivorax sp. ANBcel31 TaxID=3069754 RepID=UPI0027B6EB26|nr:rhomboid family intramembrane serine protease [Herbivorax sp. ANBcel31]MDQ2088115.1 rhomboid family intramembrane serine protease [Herbivorax sp. ANBcel31]